MYLISINLLLVLNRAHTVARFVDVTDTVYTIAIIVKYDKVWI